MWMPSQVSGRDRRADERFAITQDCTLIFEEHSARCRTRDLSFGGARLAMPLAAVAYPLDSLRSLQINGVGFLKAEVRWTDGHEIGLQFQAADGTRAALATLMRRHGVRPMLRPMTG